MTANPFLQDVVCHSAFFAGRYGRLTNPHTQVGYNEV